MDTPTKNSALTPTDWVVYEQPLNERMRTLLRCERLLSAIYQPLSNPPSQLEQLSTFQAIIDVLNWLDRLDVRSECLQSMDSVQQWLQTLTQIPGIDVDKLNETCDLISQHQKALDNFNAPLEKALKEDAFLQMLRQKGGALMYQTSFDSPWYYCWQQQSYDTKNQDIKQWRERLSPLYDALVFTLDLIRESASPSTRSAQKGYYQHDFAKGTQSPQLIRVIMPSSSVYFPEISGNKHRFNVRFLQASFGHDRPSTTEHDIDFEVSCCTI